MVGILNAIVPLFTLILGVYFFKSKPSKANIIGIMIGLFGAVFLTVNNLSTVAVLNIYVSLVVMATVCYAISINVIKKYFLIIKSILPGDLKSRLIILMNQNLFARNQSFNQ